MRCNWYLFSRPKIKIPYLEYILWIRICRCYWHHVKGFLFHYPKQTRWNDHFLIAVNRQCKLPGTFGIPPYHLLDKFRNAFKLDKPETCIFYKMGHFYLLHQLSQLRLFEKFLKMLSFIYVQLEILIGKNYLRFIHSQAKK